MRMYDVIDKKRNCGELTQEELAGFVKGYTAGEIPDYQASALLMAICINGMTDRETTWLTLEMAHSGKMVDLSSISGKKVDKHSTGGVGDKTTLICAPIAAACGVKVAKMSGRGLGHTGGTVDKLESIPGYCTAIGEEEFFRLVEKNGLALVGQSGDLAPADKKLYALRDVTATVKSIPLIASSIMSKKLAAGSDKILLDVKTGTGAFLERQEDAEALARLMCAIGEEAGRETVALLTSMNAPLGRTVGNSLEVMEAVEILQGKGPEDLRQISLELAANMICLAEKGTLVQCRRLALEALDTGAAFQKFVELVEGQGGCTEAVRHPEMLPQGQCTMDWTAPCNGWLAYLHTDQIGEASRLLGAGRQTKEDILDYGAGIRLLAASREMIKKGQPVARLYAAREELFPAAMKALERGLAIVPNPPEKGKKILARITAQGIERYE